jgi:hypothetical protein
MRDSHGYDDPGWFQDRGETVFWAIEPASIARDPGPVPPG